MNSYITSQIRTYVPIFVGTLLTYLAKHFDFVIDENTSVALVTATQGMVIGLYYLTARTAERKWPQVGKYLLGSSSQPVYRSVK